MSDKRERPAKTLTLLHGQKTIVDASEFHDLQQFIWYLGSGGYVYAQINGRPIAMHAYLMKTPKGMHTDHINRNRLDNRRSNLRVCTPQENLANRRSFNGAANPFFGKTHSDDFKSKVSEKWRKPVMQLTLENQTINQFDSTLAAEKATGVSNGNISSVCTGRRKTAGGYKWQYAKQ